MPRVGTTVVEVNVNNENDNSPEFRESLYTADFPENIPSGTLITMVRYQVLVQQSVYLLHLQVEAVDEDSGDFGELEFRLSDEDLSKPFNITTLPSGFAEIASTQLLDYEISENYTLTVIVEDLGEDIAGRRSVFPSYSTAECSDLFADLVRPLF